MSAGMAQLARTHTVIARICAELVNRPPQPLCYTKAEMAQDIHARRLRGSDPIPCRQHGTTSRTSASEHHARRPNYVVEKTAINDGDLIFVYVDEGAETNSK